MQRRGAGGVSCGFRNSVGSKTMKSLGRKADGARLERMRASALWSGESFRNLHPIAPGLRDLAAPKPSLSEFLCGGPRRVPQADRKSVV